MSNVGHIVFYKEMQILNMCNTDSRDLMTTQCPKGVLDWTVVSKNKHTQYTVTGSLQRLCTILKRKKKKKQMLKTQAAAAALTLVLSQHCSELIQKLLINRKLLIILLGSLPIRSKDYTFPWQNSRLPVKAKLLLLQLVSTQRTPVWERETF